MSQKFFLDEHCRIIFTILVVHGCYDKDTAMRFNELERKLSSWGAEISTPTVISHLSELQKLKAVKRVKRGKQNVGYHITGDYPDVKDEVEKEFTWISRNQEILKKAPLQNVASFMVDLMALRDYYVVKLSLQRFFEPQRRTSANIQLDVLDEHFRFMIRIMWPALEGKEKEYDQTMAYLDKQIEAFRKVLFKRTMPGGEKTE